MIQLRVKDFPIGGKEYAILIFGKTVCYLCKPNKYVWWFRIFGYGISYSRGEDGIVRFNLLKK